VDVVTVRRGDLFAPVRATGTVTPIRESRVGAKVAGRLQSMNFVEGNFVKEGRVLAEIEHNEFQLARNSAEAQLAMARASLQEAELNLEHIAVEKGRIEKLYKKNAVSKQKYDELSSTHAMALARVESLKAQIRSAKANLKLAERQLADTVIRAPFSGYVTKKMSNRGEVIAAGTPLYWIMDFDRVRTEVKIPETDLQRIDSGMPVSVEFDALPGDTFEGTVSEINTAIDPVSRNATVKIIIPNGKHRIWAGMFARVTIKTDVTTDVILVPERALVTDGKGVPAVFVFEDGRARLKRVVPGIRAGGLAEIREGLTGGEQVLVSGNFGLTDGAEVTPQSVEY
ncbi:MAG TPA: efflux RND transporter periplasmic adaptor subunit, partial [Deltaproteobacteria bacterium]|nr:efflux RND transporter periplasmic adaptor subunit [Deltaproteobacteria bacterium]